jgi:hypothetical protein
MTTVESDSHRGEACKAVSTTSWIDCHDLTDEIECSADGALSVLSDLWKADLVHRQSVADAVDVDYEYRPKTERQRSISFRILHSIWPFIEGLRRNGRKS